MKEIEIATKKLVEYIEKEGYKSYDPYDALKSPLFKLRVLNKSKFIRFGVQQFLKRSPINLRPLLFIPKSYNAITLGLCIQGYANLMEVYPGQKDTYLNKIHFLISELESLISKGFSGACWGLDFDWQGRYANIPANHPSIVATSFITSSLFKVWEITKIEKCEELIKSAARFVVNDINRTYEGENFCFSYSPFDKQCVYNASMKGARILAQASFISKDDDIVQLAKQAISYVMIRQNHNGSFAYSDVRKWVDNYHTGYILDALDDYIKLTSDKTYRQNLESGFEYYYQSFFREDGMPRFYVNQNFPGDCTAASQSILTLCRFGKMEKAKSVAAWTIKNMQRTDGGFYFRKFKYYTVKISYMRWSNAWMFAALSNLINCNSNGENKS